MKTAFSIILAVLLLISCERSEPDLAGQEKCINPKIDHAYSANVASWFSSSQYKSSGDIFIKMSSNTGLTESMKIAASKGFYSQYPATGSCDPIFRFPLQKFVYSSSLYNITFEVSKGYISQWGDYTGTYVYSTYKDGDPPLPLDSGCIVFAAPAALIRFDMVPDSSKDMVRPYASTSEPFYRFLHYADCFEYIGSYTVKGEVFNQVFRLKNSPVITSGLDMQLSYIWIDKEYGVIQLQQKNGTIWYLEVK